MHDERPWPKPFIIAAVRTLIIALMLTLLPLRGWIGNAMAMEMADAAPAATAVTASTQIHCPDHMASMGQMPAVGDHATASGHDAHGSTHSHCSACELCHAVDAAMAPAQLSHGPLAPLPLALHAQDFADAEVLQDCKPPIFLL